MEARAEQPSPSQEKGRGNQLEPVPPSVICAVCIPDGFAGSNGAGRLFLLHSLLRVFCVPDGFAGRMRRRVGQPLSVPTIWVAYPCGFVYARVGLLDVLLSRADAPGVLWTRNRFSQSATGNT